jgi:hypothetical protein
MINTVSILIGIVINIIFVAPVLWLAGRALVGGTKARFTDAIWIVASGVILGTVIGVATSGLIGGLIQLVVWLYLVKRFFDCGWLMAFAISIIAVIFYGIIVLALAFLGVALFSIF